MKNSPRRLGPVLVPVPERIVSEPEQEQKTDELEPVREPEPKPVPEPQE